MPVQHVKSVQDYHCTIEFYVTHFLVQEGKAGIGKRRRRTLRIDRIDKASSKWKGGDILIFNSAHWWTHSKTSEGYFSKYFQVVELSFMSFKDILNYICSQEFWEAAKIFFCSVPNVLITMDSDR